MSHIGVLGTNDFTLGFSLAGVKGTVAISKPEDELIRMMDSQEYGIIIVEEKLLSGLGSRAKLRAEQSVKPVVIALSEESSGDDLRRMIIRSIGVDLW